MLLIERLFRRISYSFGLALIVTSGFIGSEVVFYLPIITWIVAFVLFISSWRIQKEYSNIMMKFENPNERSKDPIDVIVGDKPRLHYLIWAAIYTLGTYIVVMLPLDWFIEGTRPWRPIFMLFAVVIYVIARLVDEKARPSFYNKKS